MIVRVPRDRGCMVRFIGKKLRPAKPRNAYQRACVASDFLTRDLPLTREFDNCFEEFDGDEVMAYLVAWAQSNPVLDAALRRHWPQRAKQAKLPGVKPETQPLFCEFGYDLPDEEQQAKLIRQQRPELFEFTEQDQETLEKNKGGAR